MFNVISTFENICRQCSTLAVSNYRFLITSKKNSQYLTVALEHLTGCLEHTPDENFPISCNYKSLFVSLNTDLCTSNQYFDTLQPVSNINEALERFSLLNGIKTENQEKLRPKIKQEIPTSKIDRTGLRIKTAKVYSSPRIPTSEMIYDKLDPSVLKCKDCFKIFLSIPNLRSHFMRIHAPKQFKCNECPKSFASKSFLYQHKKENHISLMCSECGKTFTNKHTLKMHEKGHYLKIICPDCGRVYKNSNTFKKHKDNNICQIPSRHSPADAKFTCDYCQKKYTQKMTLRVHIQYEHGNYKYHECKWCQKKFYCQSRLKAHIVKHTKERNFMCSFCNGKFVTKESLLYHTRIHTGEKPYKCNYCESRFLSTSRRAAHVKSQHIDPKSKALPTIECNICQSKFKTHHYLQKHKKIHINTEMVVKQNEMDYKPSDPQIKLQDINMNSGKIFIYPDDSLKIEPHERVVEIDVQDEHQQLEEHSILNQQTLDLMYQMNDGDSQNTTDGDERVYLKVSDDDGEYIITVSETVEV